MNKFAVAGLVVLVAEAASIVWLLGPIPTRKDTPRSVEAAPKQGAAIEPKPAPQPRCTPTGMTVLRNARQVRDEIINTMSGKNIRLNANGTVSVSYAHVAMFEHEDTHCWESTVDLLHLAGSVSMKLNYGGEELSRFVAEKTLPRLQQLALQSCEASPITNIHSVRMYRSLELVTYLGKRVKIQTRHGECTGIFKGARIILKTCDERVYLYRVSGDDQEWEIQVDLNELAEGIATARLF